MPETETASPTLAAPSLSLRWLMRGLALVALIVTSYLAWASLTYGYVLGCGQVGLPCEHVLRSKWAYWLGWPVSLAGVGVYLSMLAALSLAGPRQPVARQRQGWSLLIALAVGASGAAVWFVAIQVVSLQQFCWYCNVAHACALTLLALVLWRAPIAWQGSGALSVSSLLSRKRLAALSGLGLAGVAVLVAGQVLVPPPPGLMVQRIGSLPDLDTGPASAATAAGRRVSVLGGRATLSLSDWPVAGSPQAPHVLVYLMDYTCPHCQNNYARIQRLQRRYGSQVAIVRVPVSTGRHCPVPEAATQPELENDACIYARLTLALWKVNPAVLDQWNGYLYASVQPPGVRTATDWAGRLVDRAALERTRGEPWVYERLVMAKRLYAAAGLGPVPKLIVGTLVLSGEPVSDRQLFRLMERELGIKPER